MANFKPIRLLDAQVSSWPIKPGQLIFTTDKPATYLDISDTSRIHITDIIQITEDERLSMLAPVSGFYYTIDYHCFWYSDGIDWFSMSVKPEDIAPIYSSISDLTALQSGETLPVAFPKIQLAINTLIEHLVASNPHNISKASLGLGKVENKTSTEILTEMTAEHIKSALGYMPESYDIATSTVPGLIKSGGEIYVDAKGNVTLVAVRDWAKSDKKPDYTASEIGLGNLTNDKQMKAVENSTENRIVVFGADGSIVKDSGVTVDDIKYFHPKHTAYNSGLYKVTVDEEGHITGATAVTKDDIVALGIPGEIAEQGVATDTTPGIVKGGDNIFIAQDGTISVKDNSHSHTIENVTDLQKELDKRSLTGHGHSITEVAGLQESLNSKSPSDHTHTMVNGHTVEADVPADAKFTDTVYTPKQHPAYASGLYKITTDEEGSVTAATPVDKQDIVDLGIPAEAGGGGLYRGSTAPKDTEMLWIDTSNNDAPKYYNGSAWVNLVAVWG